MNTKQITEEIVAVFACTDRYGESCDNDCDECRNALRGRLDELVAKVKMDALAGEYEKTEDWQKCKDVLYKALKKKASVEALDKLVIKMWGEVDSDTASAIEEVVKDIKSDPIYALSCETCEDYCIQAGKCKTGQGCQPDGISARMHSKGYWEGRANFVADAIKEIQRLYHDGGELEDLEGWLRQQR